MITLTVLKLILILISVFFAGISVGALIVEFLDNYR